MRARTVIILASLLMAAAARAQLPETPHAVGLPETPRLTDMSDNPLVGGRLWRQGQSGNAPVPQQGRPQEARPQQARPQAQARPLESEMPMASASSWIDRIPMKSIIPPPPARGSQREKDEIAEILKARATATPARLAQARYDNDNEHAGIFAGAIGPGWDLARLPKTRFLIERIMYVDRPDSGNAKRLFPRSRPWIVDSRVETCAPHEEGPATNSYPSGHTMLGFELGVVLASLMPNHAQAILARAEEYGQSRIVCGFHFRSDVVAGKQFGSALAVEMMKHPVFQTWFREVQGELRAAGLADGPGQSPSPAAAPVAPASTQGGKDDAQIALPDVLAVELPRGASQIGPTDPPLGDLLAAARSGTRKVTSDLRRKVGVGPVRVTFSAWNGAPGSGSPAAIRTARLFVLPFGMTPVGVSGDENATGGNNAMHIARDATGRVHMVWQDGGRGHDGPVYRRAATGADGSVRFETGPVPVAGDGPSDWNAYPALAVRGRDVQLVWQGGGTARTRRISPGAEGWTMGPVIDTGAKSEGRDVGDSIAFDDKGGLHIVTPSGVYAFSADGGKSWKSEPIPLPSNASVKTQSVTVDPAGTVHVAMSAPMKRVDPAGRKLGGYWPLLVIDRTASGWSSPTDVLAKAPGWKEAQDGDDVLADWARIMADGQGGLHLTWHGTAFSRKFSHDAAFYAWKKPGGAWSAPVTLFPADPAQGVGFSYAPSLALENGRALALVFYDVHDGPKSVGFDASLDFLKDGRLQGPPLPVSRFVGAAIRAKHPDSAMGPRFPGSAPAVFHAPGGAAWLDVLEAVQSPFQPEGPNLVVYRRLDLAGR